MLDLFYLLDASTTCDELDGAFGGILRAVILLIKIGIPIVLIIMGMMDLGKAVTSQKDDEMKKAQSILVKRVIYAVLVFLVVQIVQLAFSILGTGSNPDSTEDKDAIECIDTLINGNGNG